MKNFWNVDCIPWSNKIKIRICKQTSTPQTIKADTRTHEGFCSRSMLQAHFARVSTHEEAFSSSLNLPRELAPKYLTCLISWSILRGGNSALEVTCRLLSRMKCTHEIVGTYGGALLPERAPGACAGGKTPRMYRP